MSDDGDRSSRQPSSEPLSTSSSLLGRLRSRDEGAWRQMVDLYYPLVYGWCVRGGVPSADVADVVQEVFRGVSAGIAGFRRDRDGDTFRGWLRVLTRNKVSDYWRRHPAEGRGKGGSTAQQALQALTAPADGDSAAEDGTAEAGLVQRALDLLRGEFEASTWQAFWRTAVEEHRPADVAAELGISVASVYQAKSRVLRRLRELLGDSIDQENN